LTFFLRNGWEITLLQHFFCIVIWVHVETEKLKPQKEEKTGTQKQRGWLVIVSDNYRKERWKQKWLKIIIIRKHRKGLKRRKHKKLKNNN